MNLYIYICDVVIFDSSDIRLTFMFVFSLFK